MTAEAQPTAIPWGAAVDVAARLGGTHPLESSYHGRLLERQAPELVAEAETLVADETGLATPGRPQVSVVSRADWAAANIDFFSRIFAPVEAKLQERLADDGGGFGARLSRSVMAYEVGGLLGVLSRRVLGQYELVLPKENDDKGDVVFLVGPNVLMMERQHQFVPREFRAWIALHECTHRAQFLGVPWMQGYFLGLIEDLVSMAVPEPGRLGRLIGEIRKAAEGEREIIDDTGLLGLFVTPGQREKVDRVQALMSLLEGHGHVVMDRIGARTLQSQGRMAAVLKARRQDPRTAAFYRLTGLEMKMRQYEKGETFVLGVEKHAGWDALEAAWATPENIPTLAEIDDPKAWLARVS